MNYPGGDPQLQATQRQAAHNNRLKKACYDNEEHIKQLHSSEYTDKVQYQLQQAHKLAEEHLASLEAGLKWNLTTSYDVTKLMRQCGLELSIQELFSEETPPNYFDLVPIKKEFSSLRKLAAKAADTRPLLDQSRLSDAVAQSLYWLEEIEDSIKNSNLDASKFAKVPNLVVPKVKEALLFVKVDDALQFSTDEQEALKNKLAEVKQGQSKALVDGEMLVAEEASYQLIDILEQLLGVIGNKFATINNKEEEEDHFNDVFDMLRGSNKSSLALKKEYRTLKQRCEVDLSNVHASISKSDAKDVQSLAEFSTYKEAALFDIRSNVVEQEQIWKDMRKHKYTTLLPDIINKLRELGQQRYNMIMVYLDRVDTEEMRKVEYQQFLEIVASHKKNLELTVENSNTAVACIGKMEQIMNIICLSMRQWHDIVMRQLYDLSVQVHREHLEFYRELYLTIGNLIYKKEKRVEDINRSLRQQHIQLELAAETFDPNAKEFSEKKKNLIHQYESTKEEIEMLKAKAEQVTEEFTESEDALRAEGFDFVHPVDEYQQIVLQQREKIVAYKAQFYKEDDVRIAAEREEIRRLIALSSRGKQYSIAANGTNATATTTFSQIRGLPTPTKLNYSQ